MDRTIAERERSGRGDGLGAAAIPPCWLAEASGARGATDGWTLYWEELRDAQRLFREQSDEYVRRLEATSLLRPDSRVLDFGCGFGWVADALAPRVGALYLWDSSANMRRRTLAKVRQWPNVRFVDLSDGGAGWDALRLDVILVNSVAQYMTPAELSAWMTRWRDMLDRDGRLVLSDLIPPGHRPLADVADLLRFIVRRGFLVRAVRQALGELMPYRRKRQACPLVRIGPADLVTRSAGAGLAVRVLPRNLTHFRSRMTAVLTRHAQPPAGGARRIS